MSFGYFGPIAIKLSMRHLDIRVYCSEVRERPKTYLEITNIKMAASTNSD